MILSQEKVVRMLDSCRSLKYKTLFTLAYSSGLRTSELRDLTVRDIDFDRKQVYVRKGKNGRSRYSILGNKTIQLLRTYMNVYRPHSFLFYNQEDSTTRVHRNAISKELKKLVDQQRNRRSRGAPAHVETLFCYAPDGKRHQHIPYHAPARPRQHLHHDGVPSHAGLG